MRALIAEDDLVSRLLLQTYRSRYGACDVAVNGKTSRCPRWMARRR
jgi:hypothetical protein